MRAERMTPVRHQAETKSDSASRSLFKDVGPNALPSKGQAGRRLGYPWQALATRARHACCPSNLVARGAIGFGLNS
jgi:hypothetical protein